METNPQPIEEAFYQVINTRGIYRQLGIAEGTVSSLRTAFKNGRVTINKMREILSLAGYKMVQQEKWELNESKNQL